MRSASTPEATTPYSSSALEADRQLAWALIKAIEIIGEAAGQLSEETKTDHSYIPCRDIIGMRNRLKHNLDILWKTGIDGLPPL
ncbi:hypothetical protein LBMAG41_26120 [Cyanobium sp.]|nr:hypothetical protein LBMAG41_26120 [Cyanobium sp.]